MKLTVKDLDLAAGNVLVAVLNEKDAHKLDLRSADRVILQYKKKKITCLLNISESKKSVKEGHIGLFEEVLKQLGVKHNQTVNLELTGKPESIKHIRDKLFGKTLNYEELFHIVRDITGDKLDAIEKTYFVSASFIQGLSNQEIVDLTKAMVETGEKIKFSKVTLDKHCVGGVPGNRTTMVVIPIIAAAGYTIPKTSSRAITSPAGTADTMECLARVELPQNKIKTVVKKTGACIVHGGSMNLAPADDKIIDVEHPLSIDAEGQLLASVMAKKYSVSANHVLIDIPMGKEVKTKNKKEANHLKKMFEMVGKKLGMNVKVIVTDGSQPIGSGIGPLLEAEDVMAVLRNDPLAPQDLRKKALCMAAVLLKMAGEKRPKKVAKEMLESGRALKKMNDIIKAQGKQKQISLGKYRYDVKAFKPGKIREIRNGIIAKIARVAGAPLDKGAGMFLQCRVGHKVQKNDVLYTVYAESEFKMNLVKDILKKNKGVIIN